MPRSMTNYKETVPQLTLRDRTSEYVADQVHQWLDALHIRIDEPRSDTNRPWGGFMRIDEQDTQAFVQTFYPELASTITHEQISPKILMVAPQQLLSWQWHQRRAEIWRVVGDAAVAVYLSDTDIQPPVYEWLYPDETVHIAQGERHRLQGLYRWGIIAEIWRHTDPSHPSDENDIIRVSDVYNRT